MKFLISAILLMLAQTSSADPGSTVNKTGDGLTGQCSVAADIGNWAFRPAAIPVTQNGNTLDVTWSIDFLRCTEVSPATLLFTSQLPFEPIQKVVDGKIVITNTLQSFAVMMDGDSYALFAVPVANVTPQDFHYALDISALAAKISGLRAGQSLTKTYYFVTQSKVSGADGIVHPSVSGSYQLDVTWTKQGPALTLSSRVH